jgi:hypothetical protein
MEDFFQKHNDSIKAGLQRIAPQAGLSGDLTLVDGLVFLDVQKNPNIISIGSGPRIPMIVVIDNQNGRIHQFALKIVCPDISF